MLPLAALPVALALALLVSSLRERREAVEDNRSEDIDNGPAEMLRRWQARAQMLAARADGTRADWDRHLRPLLAKEFELSAGNRVAKDRRTLEAAGLHVFGPQLWRWVDPADSDVRDQSTPAPGRAALDEILGRLQRMGDELSMTMPLEATVQRADAVLRELSRVVVGKQEELRLIMIAVLSGGHILIEDLPGLGKTLIARSFAAALGLEFTRVQFTPDLLP